MDAVTRWITERLNLEVSPEKTRIVNVRKRYSEFLGFKIKVYRKGEKYVVKSHICDKKLQLEESKLRGAGKTHCKTELKSEKDRTKLVCSMKWCWAYRIITGLPPALVWTAGKSTAGHDSFDKPTQTRKPAVRLVREGGAMTESEKERFGVGNDTVCIRHRPTYLPYRIHQI